MQPSLEFLKVIGNGIEFVLGWLGDVKCPGPVQNSDMRRQGLTSLRLRLHPDRINAHAFPAAIADRKHSGIHRVCIKHVGQWSAGVNIATGG